MTFTVAEAALFVSAAPVLSILVKATIALAAGLAAAWLARRQRASVRHLLLAATFGALMAIPVLVILGPDLAVEVPVSARPSTPSPEAATPSRESAALAPNITQPATTRAAGKLPSWTTVATTVWLAGALLLMLSLAADLFRIRRIVRQGLPLMGLRQKAVALGFDAGVRRAVDVMRHENVAAPFMCGVWRPAIVLPASADEWRDEEIERALVHELEHVRRHDWATQIAARATCALYWWHPLVWVAWRRLCLEAERACDDAVVRQADSADYAEQLVALAARLSTSGARPVLGMANRSDLASRVRSVLDANGRRGRVGRLTATAALAAAALVVAVIAPLRAIEAPRATVERADAATSPEDQTSRQPRRQRSSRFDAAIYEAASDGDVEAVAALLDDGANVNAVIPGDGSPLIAAAREGHLDVARLLIDRGADLDRGVRGDGNALIMAAREGHLEIVRLLLDRGADVERVVPGDENALIQASGSGKRAVVELLLARGANVNARVLADRFDGRDEWRTPLGMARRGGHDEIATLLQSHGAIE